ncbi:MAG: hypothetical protein J6X80_04845 [Lachnospiraceae bacterium]|nr:hypothetical protein [Lachnospiraceae bacterium]
MACFLVPGTEAIVSTIVTAVVKSKEKKDLKRNASVETKDISEKIGTKFSTKLGWLNKMLWGGSALLAFEHVWHGEVIPVFPFLTAVKDGEAAGMLQEMGTAGVTMAVLVTAAWIGMVIVSSAIEKRQSQNEDTKEVKA